MATRHRKLLDETSIGEDFPRGRKDAKFGYATMEKLYVNEIAPDGTVSTVGLFYSQEEAQKIIELLRDNPDRAGYRYEILEAVRNILSKKEFGSRTRSLKE